MEEEERRKINWRAIGAGGIFLIAVFVMYLWVLDAMTAMRTAAKKVQLAALSKSSEKEKAL